VAGYEYDGTSYNYGRALLWKNGEMTTLAPEGAAVSVFVAP